MRSDYVDDIPEDFDFPHKPSRGRGGGAAAAAASAAAAAAAAATISAHHDGEGFEGETEIREQDRFLPVANIARIMKKVLPYNAKMTKDSKEAIQECVSEFISFITQEASDKCKQEKRKTINGDDLLWAMGTLGFEKYIEPLKIYLQKYREASKGDKSDSKRPALGALGASSSLHPSIAADHGAGGWRGGGVNGAAGVSSGAGDALDADFDEMDEWEDGGGGGADGGK